MRPPRPRPCTAATGPNQGRRRPSTTSASPARYATGSPIRRASNTRLISRVTMMSGSSSIASWRWTWGAFIPRSRDRSCSTRLVAGMSPLPRVRALPARPQGDLSTCTSTKSKVDLGMSNNGVYEIVVFQAERVGTARPTNSP